MYILKDLNQWLSHSRYKQTSFIVPLEFSLLGETLITFVTRNVTVFTTVLTQSMDQGIDW